MNWQKSANDFLCSFNGLRHLRVIDSFSTLPLLAPGIIHQGETLRLINVSCGEHMASKLTKLGPGATNFAPTLMNMALRCISLESLTFNLDKSFYDYFVRHSLTLNRSLADTHLQETQVETALRSFQILEYLGIVTPVVCNAEQPLYLWTGLSKIRALAPRVRSPTLRLLKIEMGKNLRHEKLPHYGWARALLRKQTWHVGYGGAKLAIWETDQADLDWQLSKVVGQPYDPPADLRARDVWSKYMRQIWAVQTRFCKTDGPIPNWYGAA